MSSRFFRRWKAWCAVLIIAACVPPRSEAPAPGEPSEPPADQGADASADFRSRLSALLGTEITPAQDTAFVRLLAVESSAVRRELRTLALDRDAPPLVRANAVVRMGELRMRDWTVYRGALRDPDPRTRGAVLGAVGPFYWQQPDSVRALMLRGLADAEPAVQAKALQELGDRDAAVLRWFLARESAPDLQAVARDLLRMAEERGAPLAADETGALERTALSGVRVRFEPYGLAEAAGGVQRQRGRLLVAPPDGEFTVVADSVFAVDRVVPAAVSPTGRYVAYETASTVRVRDLRTGTEQDAGGGIAPRSFPFTDDFLYFAAEPAPPAPGDRTELSRYDVFRASFDGAVSVKLGSVALPPGSESVNLNALRRARIMERDGRLVLQSTAFIAQLPSPFADVAR